MFKDLDSRAVQIQRLALRPCNTGALLHQLEKEADPVVRYMLIDALGKTGGLRTLHRLVSLKDWDQNPALQGVVQRAVEQILRRLHGRSLYQALVVVLRQRPELLPLLHQRLERPDVSPQTRLRLSAFLSATRHYVRATAKNID